MFNAIDGATKFSSSRYAGVARKEKSKQKPNAAVWQYEKLNFHGGYEGLFKEALN